MSEKDYSYSKFSIEKRERIPYLIFIQNEADLILFPIRQDENKHDGLPRPIDRISEERYSLSELTVTYQTDGQTQ